MDRRAAQERMADLRAGTIAAAVYNAMSGGKRGGGSFTALDIFPERTRARQEAALSRSSGPTGEQVYAGLLGWAAMCGARVN